MNRNFKWKGLQLVLQQWFTENNIHYSKEKLESTTNKYLREGCNLFYPKRRISHFYYHKQVFELSSFRFFTQFHPQLLNIDWPDDDVLLCITVLINSIPQCAINYISLLRGLPWFEWYGFINLYDLLTITHAIYVSSIY